VEVENSEIIPLILDGARSNNLDFGSDTKLLAEKASNKSNSLAIRVEAFSEIIDIEIGDTNLNRARHIERKYGMRQIYLKFEGSNPTGTQKDRIAFAHTLDALNRGFNTICVASCGNYGAAMALAASLAGLECIVFIPESFHTKRIEDMVKFGAQIERVKGDYETSVIVCGEYAREKGIYDANPSGANAQIQLTAYAQIADEIYDVLRDAPAAIAMPVSNGTTIAGVHRGFEKLFRRGKTSRIPRMIAGSSFHKNPIVESFLSGADNCLDLDPRKIKETITNEPLINWHSIDGEDAFHAIKASLGDAAHVTDKAMKDCARLLAQEEGMNALTASTAGLLALLQIHNKSPLANDRYVAVVTGRK